MYEDRGLIREDVASFSPLAFQLLLPFPLLFLKEQCCYNMLCQISFVTLDIFMNIFWQKHKHFINLLCTSRSSSARDGSSSSTALLSIFSGSLDSSTCSSTFSCFVSRAISCDFKPLELRVRQSSSFRRSFTYKRSGEKTLYLLLKRHQHPWDNPLNSTKHMVNIFSRLKKRHHCHQSQSELLIY